MGKRQNLSGSVFERWTVTGRAEGGGNSKAQWDCRCACGKERAVLANSLLMGKSTSCGCQRSESIAAFVVDLTGQTFGRLTVLHRVENDKHGKTRWLCRCVCGTEMARNACHMRKGESLSCGCLQRETNVSAPTVHGHAKVGRATKEYVAWTNMIARCENTKATRFDAYGGRGITVCDRWRHDFVAFLADMGPRPSSRHTIDRFPDNDGNYEPGNCRWATMKEQGRNKRNNRLVTFNGETLTIAEWGERLDSNGTVVGIRLRNGWSDARAVTDPARPHPRRLASPSIRINLSVTA